MKCEIFVVISVKSDSFLESKYCLETSVESRVDSRVDDMVYTCCIKEIVVISLETNLVEHTVK